MGRKKISESKTTVSVRLPIQLINRIEKIKNRSIFLREAIQHYLNQYDSLNELKQSFLSSMKKYDEALQNRFNETLNDLKQLNQIDEETFDFLIKQNNLPSSAKHLIKQLIQK